MDKNIFGKIKGKFDKNLWEEGIGQSKKVGKKQTDIQNNENTQFFYTVGYRALVVL